MKSLQKRNFYIYNILSFKHQINFIETISTLNFTFYLKTIKNLLIFLKKKLKIVYNYLLLSFKVKVKNNDNYWRHFKSIMTKLNSNVSLNYTNALLVSFTLEKSKFLKKTLTEKKITVNENEIFFFLNCINIFLFKQFKQNIIK